MLALTLVVVTGLSSCLHFAAQPAWQKVERVGKEPAAPPSSATKALTAAKEPAVESEGKVVLEKQRDVRKAFAVKDLALKENKTTPVAAIPSDSAVLGIAEEGDGDVVVHNGYVCVPEKSSMAESLAQILEGGINEDLSAAVVDQKASKIDPIKVVDHPDVQRWVQRHLSNRALFQRYLNRGANFKTLVIHILEEEGLPPELFYLAMVESGFRPSAKSSASAVGIWQFIRSTGRRYGLKINYYVDERKDPVRATRAASRYLASLYRVYQNWELAAAAYNAGESRVLSAIMRGHTRDFWELSRRRLLPRETRDYVPKMMAAMKIGQNLEQYGFRFEVTDNYGIPVAAKIPGAVRLRDVAAVAGVTEKSLRSLNPHLKRGMTPPEKSYKIWVAQPSQSKALVSAYSTLSRKRQRLASRSKTVSDGYHLVRRGQNLESISRRYGTTVKELKRLNGMRGTLIYVGQRLKIPTTIVSGKLYVIKKGDTLYSIAKRYKTSVKDLQRKNKILGSRVFAGQKIRI